MGFYSLNTKTCEGLLSLLVLYLIVGVVKVHRLTKSHFRFCPQVIQLDGSRELQDPTEKNRGQMSAAGRHGWKLGTCSRPHLFSPLNSNFTLTSFWWREGNKKFSREQGENSHQQFTEHRTWFLGEDALGLPRSDRNMAGRLERCSSAKSCMIEFSASCSSVTGCQFISDFNHKKDQTQSVKHKTFASSTKF